MIGFKGPAGPAMMRKNAGHDNGGWTMTAPGNAVHDLDHPNLQPRERTGLAYTGDGTGVARIGTDPRARADAIARVSKFLAQ